MHQVERDLTLTQCPVTLRLPRVTTTLVPLRQLASPTTGLTAYVLDQLLELASSHELTLHGQVLAMARHIGHLRGLRLVTSSDHFSPPFLRRVDLLQLQTLLLCKCSNTTNVHHHVQVC
jgi:hypothetical protein